MPRHRNKNRRIPRALMAAMVIVAFGSISVILSIYAYEWFGSPGQRCHDSCASQNKEGLMVRTYPQSMTGSRGSPSECLCH